MDDRSSIPGFPGYYATRDGRIFSALSMKWLTPNYNGTGYFRVMLKHESGRFVFRFVHRLVAITFLKRSIYADVVDHIDGNKRNNDAENLRWCTQKENVAYERLRNGPRGHTKISAGILKQIRKRLAKGDLQRVIAEDVGLTRPMISYIKAHPEWNPLSHK